MAPAVDQRGEFPPASVVTRGSGAPLLLLHGWGSWAALWGPVHEALAHQRCAVAPDLPGFGGTPPPPDPWSVDDYVQWVVALLDRLGIERTDIVGHSFGCQLAVRLATSRPERVDRLVLVGAAVIRHAPTPAQRVRIALFKSARRASTMGIVPSAARRRLDAWVASRGSEDYRATSGTMRASFVRVLNENLEPELSLVRASTLLISGDRDTDVPITDARVLEKRIPDAGLVVFEGAGHFPHTEQPERFVRIVEHFLAPPGSAASVSS